MLRWKDIQVGAFLSFGARQKKEKTLFWLTTCCSEGILWQRWRFTVVIEDWSEYKTRSLLSNFTWTDEATSDWVDIWDALWQLGFQWEWKVGDGYVRRYGESSFKYYFVHDLYLTPPQEGAIPLPQIHVLNEIKDVLLDHPGDDSRVGYAIKAINDWFSHVIFQERT